MTMSWKSIMKHCSFSILLVFFSTVAVWLIYLGFIEHWPLESKELLIVIPTSLIAGFLLGRLWLTLTQWIESGIVGLFGGLFATLTGSLCAIAESQWPYFKTLVFPVWIGLLVPFVLDKKGEDWKPAIKYGLIWAGIGFLAIILAQLLVV